MPIMTWAFLYEHHKIPGEQQSSMKTRKKSNRLFSLKFTLTRHNEFIKMPVDSTSTDKPPNSPLSSSLPGFSFVNYLEQDGFTPMGLTPWSPTCTLPTCSPHTPNFPFIEINAVQSSVLQALTIWSSPEFRSSSIWTLTGLQIKSNFLKRFNLAKQVSFLQTLPYAFESSNFCSHHPKFLCLSESCHPSCLNRTSSLRPYIISLHSECSEHLYLVYMVIVYSSITSLLL